MWIRSCCLCLVLSWSISVNAEPDLEDDPDLVTSDEELVYGEEVVVEAPPREATKRTMTGSDLREVPGTRGDAFRAIEMLPGVGRPSADTGAPMLRGASPWESLILLEGQPVPFLFHFGSLTSIVNSRLIEAVDVYPSGFGARYGRVVGGVVEARLRRPAMDGLHGVIDVSLLDSTALVEGPVGPNTSVALAARRSNIDAYFGALAPEDSYGVVAAPVYFDYQAVAHHELSSSHALRLWLYGARDRLELRLKEPLSTDPELRGDVGATVEFHNLNLSSRGTSADGSTHLVVLGVGRQAFDQRFGPGVDGSFRAWDVTLRAEWRAPVTSRMALSLGLDGRALYLDGLYRGPRPPQLEGDPSGEAPIALSPRVELGGTVTQLLPGAFVELPWTPEDGVLVVPALRFDLYLPQREVTLHPRLMTRFTVDEHTAIKSAVGLYSQSAQYYEMLEGIGNPELEPERALHASLGAERTFGDVLTVDVEGFTKRLTNRVVGTEDGSAPFFINDGVGRVFGAELAAHARFSERTSSRLGYTLSRSERRDRNGQWRLFDHDQTHNVVAAVHHDFGAGVTAGARVRTTTGNPTTPIQGSVFDASVGLYRPLYGEVGSARDGTFFQLDLLVQKSWAVGDGRVSLYLDLQNATNAQNAQGRLYSYDYSASEPVAGLPIFPNLGLRGEL